MRYQQKLILTSLGALLAGAAHAQVTLDGTVGPAGSLPGPNYAVTADLGRQVGANLFHSFGQFSIHTGESATFSGPNSVSNIIGRVTGGQLSTIDGALRSTISGANLYLLNPAGVLFGENASLDVSGSVHISTTDYLRLSDGGRFDAQTPGNSVLTVAPVSAFGFLGEVPAPITVDGSFLQVPEGQTLSLIGGDLTLTDATLYAPAGRIDLAAVGSAGEVLPMETDLAMQGFGKLGTITVEHPSANRPKIDLGQPFGEVSLGDVDTSGASGGAIFIRGGQWVSRGGWVLADNYGDRDGHGVDMALTGTARLESGSRLYARTRGAGRGGDITLTAREAVTLDSSYLNVNTEAGSTGDAGSIALDTGTLELRVGGQMAANTRGAGRGGDITITVRESAIINGRDPTGQFASGLFARAEAGSTGNAGDITLDVGSLELSGRSLISASTSGPGRGADITITARDAVILTDDSFMFARADEGSTGDAGDITLNVGSLELSAGGEIAASTRGVGRGGDINITASDDVTITGTDFAPNTPATGLFSRAVAGSGDAGSITLNAGSLNLSRGGLIISNTFTSGRGGDITITARDAMVMTDSSYLFSQSESGATADSGSITLNVGRLELSGGSQLSSGTGGPGRGGDLNLTVRDAAIISGTDPTSRFHSGLFTSTDNNTTGDAGSINLDAGRLDLSGGGLIVAGTFGKGQGGDLNLTVRDAVIISGTNPTGNFPSGLLSGAYAGAAGNTGDITLTTPDLTLTGGGTISATSVATSGGNLTLNVDHIKLFYGSEISSSVFGDERTTGGNVTINSTNVVALNGSGITAQANQGKGGNIIINAQVFLHDAASVDDVLNASSQVQGNDGTVQNNAPNSDISGSLVALSTNYLDAAGQLTDRCAEGDPDARSRFTIQGREALPLGPDQPMAAPVTGCRSEPPIPARATPLASGVTTTPTTALSGFGDR